MLLQDGENYERITNGVLERGQAKTLKMIDNSPFVVGLRLRNGHDIVLEGCFVTRDFYSLFRRVASCWSVFLCIQETAKASSHSHHGIK